MVSHQAEVGQLKEQLLGMQHKLAEDFLYSEVSSHEAADALQVERAQHGASIARMHVEMATAAAAAEANVARMQEEADVQLQLGKDANAKSFRRAAKKERRRVEKQAREEKQASDAERASKDAAAECAAQKEKRATSARVNAVEMEVSQLRAQQAAVCAEAAAALMRVASEQKAAALAKEQASAALLKEQAAAAARARKNRLGVGRFGILAMFSLRIMEVVLGSGPQDFNQLSPAVGVARLNSPCECVDK